MEKSKNPSFAKSSKDKAGRGPIKVIEEGEGVIKELKSKLEKVEKQKNEYLEGWKREKADFLNYKKEETERISTLIRYADTEFILRFLPVLDNFYSAEKKLPEDLNKDESFKGLLQIKEQIKDILKKQGLEEIESLGKKFDPTVHEAVEEIKIDGKESGIIIEEVQKGYKIHGKLLRPARVKVAK